MNTKEKVPGTEFTVEELLQEYAKLNIEVSRLATQNKDLLHTKEVLTKELIKVREDLRYKRHNALDVFQESNASVEHTLQTMFYGLQGHLKSKGFDQYTYSSCKKMIADIQNALDGKLTGAVSIQIKQDLKGCDEYVLPILNRLKAKCEAYEEKRKLDTERKAKNRIVNLAKKLTDEEVQELLRVKQVK